MSDNKPKVGGQLLVAAGKSSRLSAMADKARQRPQLADVNDRTQEQSFFSEFKPEKKLALQQATRDINQKLNSIVERYPANKRNSFFKLRYGVEMDKIKQMQIKRIYSLLHLDLTKLKQYKLVENLDLSGKPVISEND